MKRLIIATAMMLGFSLGVAEHAQAQTPEIVTCTTVGGTNLGTRFQVCNGNQSPAIDSGDTSAVAAAFNALPTSFTNSVGNVLKTYMTNLYTNGDYDGEGKGVYGAVYLFYSPAEYQAWIKTKTNAKAIPSDQYASAGAVTAIDATTYQADYTIVFKVPGTGYNQGDGTNGQNNLTPLTVHEFGHWADYLYRSLVSGQKVLSNSGLGTGIFGKEYGRDLATLDAAAVYPCSPPNMNPGVFAGRADSFVTVHNGNMPYFICSGKNVFGMTTNGVTSNGAGPTLNRSSNVTAHPDYSTQTSNGAVLQAAWGYFFKPGFVTTTRPYAELFAEAFSAGLTNGVNLNSLSATYDAYFGTINNWQGLFCTKMFVKYVAEHGTLPTSASNDYGVNGVSNPNACPLS